MSTRPAAVALVLVALASSCGGAGRRHTGPPITTSTRGVISQETASELKASAREALSQNYRLSVYVLWNNKIPAWAQHSTLGPALASLRSAAASRRARGVRIKTLSNRRKILSLALDTSYTRATAIVAAQERVVPTDRNGRALGRTLELRERGRFILRREGHTKRFVVWRVVQLQ
jgi:hypothetical protein